MRADAQGSMLRVGRTASGFLVQVEGKGTLWESPALKEFAVQSLDGQRGPSTVVVDLSHCDYLDSTFLGCLLTLHRKYNRTPPHRFQVAASHDKCQKLLAANHLSQLLDVTEVCPEPITDVMEVSRPILPTHDLGRHVMECHRRLAELGGPQEASFRSIVDQLAHELGEAPGGGDLPTGEYESPSRRDTPASPGEEPPGR
jgi:anti-anti-sigma regulatory factor